LPVIHFSRPGRRPIGEAGHGVREGEETGFESRNLSVDYRFADGCLDQLPEMAADLVPALALVTAGGVSAVAKPISTFPSPSSLGLPVALGLAASSRVGGNATGMMMFRRTSRAEAVGRLRELVPNATVSPP
jgi:putative ABC transport system substrate-binding protein